jgi:hypothetical protein
MLTRPLAQLSEFIGFLVNFVWCNKVVVVSSVWYGTALLNREHDGLTLIFVVTFLNLLGVSIPFKMNPRSQT